MEHSFNKTIHASMTLGHSPTMRFALIKFGGGVVQMSGSIAGNTFARNRYGNYVRARTKPVNPQSALQTQVRAALAALTTRWSQVLTAAQRTAWNLYASNVNMTNRLGETINLTGFNHYIRSNAFHGRRGYATYDDGPVIFEIPAADPTFAVTISEATQVATITYDDTMDWDDETGGFLLVYQGSPQNAQREFFDGPWRELGNVPGADGVPVASPYLPAVVFAVAELQRDWIYARILRADGRLSQPFRANTYVGA